MHKVVTFPVCVVISALVGTPDSLVELAIPLDLVGSFRPVAASADGACIAGNISGGTQPGGIPAVWHAGASVTLLPIPEGMFFARVAGLACDAGLIVGAGEAVGGVRLVHWTHDGSQTLGIGPALGIMAVSGDGLSAAGSVLSPGAAESAVLVRNDIGAWPLPLPDGAVQARAVGLDQHARTVLISVLMGNGNPQPRIFTPEHGVQPLAGIPTDGSFTPTALSANGRVVVGWFTPGDEAPRPFRWDQTNGFAEIITPHTDSEVRATHLSGDGSVIAGWRGPSYDSRVWFWAPTTGFRDLAKHLAEQGVETEGWVFRSVGALSRDGSVIAGIGEYNGAERGWLVRLDSLRCSPSDLSGAGAAPGADGQLSADDVITFLNAFFTDDINADVTSLGGGPHPDGRLTADDVAFFFASFFSDCR